MSHSIWIALKGPEQGGNPHTLETCILRKSSKNTNILWQLQDEEKVRPHT
ncbi:MAG: hypothetical protein HN758_11090 [Verrucomicrobia bacterium]|nr:hypothetical protein [Verrucomicrobiota bacterium]MBT4274500.1 hypothetical protein [Verrucomicrobiota bacterium]MBT5062629.1 hypothetical protein [Verrucomicrobiota bacterium]MBT5479682.1 hypothetical protein [Verrucomicrobiota bacterium]MBT6240007.1 hypothetical protein [Verrucomicrobiota bacterium]